MSRSGYSNDCYDEDNRIHLYRGRVANAIRGKRGQKFLRELLVQLDAMPERRLTTSQLQADGQVCTLGVMTRARGIDTSDPNEWQFDVDDWSQNEWVIDNLVGHLDIAEPMVREIMYMNDDGTWKMETPEDRWRRMRNWVARHISIVEQDA